MKITQNNQNSKINNKYDILNKNTLKNKNDANSLPRSNKKDKFQKLIPIQPNSNLENFNTNGNDSKNPNLAIRQAIEDESLMKNSIVFSQNLDTEYFADLFDVRTF